MLSDDPSLFTTATLPRNQPQYAHENRSDPSSPTVSHVFSPLPPFIVLFFVDTTFTLLTRLLQQASSELQDRNKCPREGNPRRLYTWRHVTSSTPFPLLLDAKPRREDVLTEIAIHRFFVDILAQRSTI